MPTPTLEEYLEAIYKLSREHPARPSALAEAMDVSAPTVTATLHRLSDRGLISRPRGGVSLTPEGEQSALTILRRHRLAERFLVDVLGLPWDDVHEDACLLEHALSPRVEDALERFLDDPQACPHGHPIPDAHLRMPDRPRAEVQLAALPAGASAVVAEVEERVAAVLTEVGNAGLYPGATVKVLRRLETRLDVEVDGAPRAISARAAEAVGVVPESDESDG